MNDSAAGREWWPPTWPQTVRLLGVGVALYGVSPLSASQDKATLLGFAGSLILAPLVAGEQQRRNRRRSLDEGE